VAIRVTYAPESRQLVTVLDGRAVLDQRVETLVTAPAQVTVGRCTADMDLTGNAFTGRITGAPVVAAR
jgi:hypothetical protein